MTAITSVSDLNSLYAPPEQEGRRSSDELGQGEFMKLMLTQLQHQDPFEPMANGEFIAQMAQFSAVAGIDALRVSMDDFVNNQNASQTLQAAQLVGKKVLVRGDLLQPPVSGTEALEINLEYELPIQSSRTRAVLYDEHNAIVDTIQLGARQPGMQQLQWTPTLEQAHNIRRVAIEFTRPDGNIENANVYQTKAVQAVTLNTSGGAAELITEDDETLSFSDIKKIY